MKVLARLFLSFILAPTLWASESPERVLFDSNRSGTFGIYSTKLDGSDLRAVVDSAAHEIFPDPSPDGQSVVYTIPRALKREAPGDLWLAKHDGSDAELLVKNGNFPFFSRDGKRISYQRGRYEFWQIELETKVEKRLFPKDESMIGEFQILVPRLSPDEKHLAFASDMPKAWRTWVVELDSNKLILIGNGCQPTWYSNSKGLAWISTIGALERSSIWHRHPLHAPGAVLHDLDAPYGHEYFPTLAKNDSLLLYAAASPGQHDAITSDYQIFVKDLKSNSVARITNDKFNNRWPKYARKLG